YIGKTVDLVNGSWTSTEAAIEANATIQDEVVFFTDTSGDGHLYVKGSGTGTDFAGTHIRLENVTTAPAADDIAFSYVIGDPPVTVNDEGFTVDEDGTLSISTSNLLANDSDPEGSALTLTTVDSAANGTVAIVGGNVEFTPDANYAGAASFEYTAMDIDGRSSSATVTLTVSPLDDAPVVGAPATLPSTAEETVTVITEAQLLANATEVDGETLQVANVTVTDATLSEPVIDPETGARSWTVTPDLDFNGDISVSYDVSDGTTAVPASTTLTVTPVDDPPVIATPASVSATEDEGIVIEGISLSDVDYADETLSVTLSVGYGELSVGEHHGSSVTLTGSLADINEELAGTIYEDADGIRYEYATDLETLTPLTTTYQYATGDNQPQAPWSVEGLTLVASDVTFGQAQGSAGDDQGQEHDQGQDQEHDHDQDGGYVPGGGETALTNAPIYEILEGSNVTMSDGFAVPVGTYAYDASSEILYSVVSDGLGGWDASGST
ncbi:MAG: cadherin-like domain-containing protein, partial [Pseudomonadota bacterium]|nr:cadherin-like domain-containing protein [Pseudomonadota bacterium]